MEALKAEKKNQNGCKNWNLPAEKDDNLQLFWPSRVQPARNFAYYKKKEKPQKEKQKKKAQKEIKKGRSILQILRQEGVLKKKELAVQKDADGEAKKTQVTVKLLANQVHKNSPGDVQKTRI